VDELDLRVRSLEAERLRPIPPLPQPPPGIDLVALAELCELLGEEDDSQQPIN
jgi:hypothetical protein